jgi:hypothetical protein
MLNARSIGGRPVSDFSAEWASESIATDQATTDL